MTQIRNIVITGFMGVGKSTIGQLVARQLTREFVDMDTVIEMREGCPISRIFAESGEPYFRQLEATLCRELAAKNGLVIATGGGALVPRSNLKIMAQHGLVVCLDCEPETLWQRIGHSQNRPMLAAQDAGRFARLANLLAERQPAYQRIKHHVDVTYLTPPETAARIVDLVIQES